MKKNKPESLPYSDQRDAVRRQNELTTQRALIESINQASVNFTSQVTDVGQRMMDVANLGRSIGQTVSQLFGNQISFDFYETISGTGEGKLRVGFDELKIFSCIANRLPDPASTISQAKAVLQLAFECVGLQQVMLPSPSKGNTIAPFNRLVLGSIGQFKSGLSKFMEINPVEQWDRELWSAIEGQLEWLDELRRRRPKYYL